MNQIIPPSFQARAAAPMTAPAATLRRLAGASQRTGDSGQAVELLTEALRLCEELGDHAQASEVRASLAESRREAG